MLTKEQVHQEVEARGSRFVTVIFLKMNGEERTINGLFKPLSHMVGDDAPRKLAPGQIPIWSAHEKKWKSFKDDRVVEIH